MDFDRYSIDDRIAVNRIYRYETLNGDFRDLCAKIGLRGDIALPAEKSSGTEGGYDYRDYYDDHLAELVARRFRREIDAFGYSFQSESPNFVRTKGHALTRCLIIDFYSIGKPDQADRNGSSRKMRPIFGPQYPPRRQSCERSGLAPLPWHRTPLPRKIPLE